MRSVIHVLSATLFGRSMPISDFPNSPDLSGIGLSDWRGYARRLPSKLSYRNFFYDHDPRLDITNPPEALYETLDFLIASDVFEHVEPPVERAFEGSFRLLRPGGVLVLTVPLSLRGKTREHFPNLHDYGIFEFNASPILVNRTANGQWEVFDDIKFHGGPGFTLEMRVFSRDSLLEQLRAAGFEEITEHRDHHVEFGISLPKGGYPIVARRRLRHSAS